MAKSIPRALIVEKISQKSYATFLKEELFNKLADFSYIRYLLGIILMKML